MMDSIASLETSEAEREADGFLKGLAVGVVTDNQDPDGLGRVRVRLPWQENGDESHWARVATLMAGPEMGAFFLPELDDEVLVGFVAGDPSHPCIIGHLWNGRRKPPTANDDGKNDERVIRTRAGHELRFNDGDDPEIELKLADDRRLFMNKDGIELDDAKGNSLAIASSEGSLKVTAATDLKISAPTITLDAKGSMELKATGQLTIKGSVVQIN